MCVWHVLMLGYYVICVCAAYVGVVVVACVRFGLCLCVGCMVCVCMYNVCMLLYVGGCCYIVVSIYIARLCDGCELCSDMLCYVMLCVLCMLWYVIVCVLCSVM